MILNESEKEIIISILERLLDCFQSEHFYLIGDKTNLQLPRYLKSKTIEPENILENKNTFILNMFDEAYDNSLREKSFCTNQKVLTIAKDRDETLGFYKIKNNNVNLDIRFSGEEFNSPLVKAPNTFRVLAIIHFYNEVDVIQKTTEYLISQGVDVYLIDNWSDDGSYEIAKKLVMKYSDHIYLERFPTLGKTDYYDWYHQLERTEQISKTLDYDWFIHYDADEMRISPYKNITLLDTIYYVDQLGYNLIENTVIDFKIVEKNNLNIFMEDGYFDFGHRQAHFEQIKTWKKSYEIDLKKSGGHLAIIDNPKIFPLKILNRHYPLRSIQQAEKKVFIDRKPRFVKEKRERGWHGHYDNIREATNLIENKNKLIKWNEHTFDEYYIQLFTGCGIEIEGKKDIKIESYKVSISSKDNIIIYGAGKIGKSIFDKYKEIIPIVAWVDKNYKRIPPIHGMIIESPEVIKSKIYDYILIGIESRQIAEEIMDTLECMGVNKEKILWEPIVKQKE